MNACLNSMGLLQVAQNNAQNHGASVGNGSQPNLNGIWTHTAVEVVLCLLGQLIKGREQEVKVPDRRAHQSLAL